MQHFDTMKTHAWLRMYAAAFVSCMLSDSTWIDTEVMKFPHPQNNNSNNNKQNKNLVHLQRKLTFISY